MCGHRRCYRTKHEGCINLCLLPLPTSDWKRNDRTAYPLNLNVLFVVAFRTVEIVSTVNALIKIQDTPCLAGHQILGVRSLGQGEEVIVVRIAAGINAARR